MVNRFFIHSDGEQLGEPNRLIFGDTTLQALMLAIRFLGMRLHDFLSRGGRVLYPDDANEGEGDIDLALDALFGPLLRHPEPANEASDE